MENHGSVHAISSLVRVVNPKPGMLEKFFLKLVPDSEWQVQAVPKALMELCSVDQEKEK